jgi:hypothetical protein
MAAINDAATALLDPVKRRAIDARLKDNRRSAPKRASTRSTTAPSRRPRAAASDRARPDAKRARGTVAVPPQGVPEGPLTKIAKAHAPSMGPFWGTAAIIAGIYYDVKLNLPRT